MSDKKSICSTLLSLIATVILLFAFGGITVLADGTGDSQPEIVASGYCGDDFRGQNISWTFDSYGMLIINGTGWMENYASASSLPWYNYRKDIKKVNISEGVTRIGNGAFNGCESLTSIVIPNSVTKSL